MKNITHNYGTALCWIESFAKKIGGKISGNFIQVPNSICEGNIYHLDCTDGISVLYSDVVYKVDYKYFQKNEIHDFIGIYYNLCEGEAKISAKGNSHKVGRWWYNFYVMDCSIESEYTVNSGYRSFSFYIFIKKDTLRTYAKKNLLSAQKIEDLLNSSKNTLIKLDRMSNESYNLLEELRKDKIGGMVFNLNLISTTHLLISDYLLKISDVNSNIMQLVNHSDLSGIIFTQRFLIEHIQTIYPGNKSIANKINMSESKFKILFKKITGTTPYVFFMENKLIKSKDLLSERKMSVLEISKQLSFSDSSYFASKFKRKYGINPKKFIDQL